MEVQREGPAVASTRTFPSRRQLQEKKERTRKLLKKTQSHNIDRSIFPVDSDGKLFLDP